MQSCSKTARRLCIFYFLWKSKLCLLTIVWTYPQISSHDNSEHSLHLFSIALFLELSPPSFICNKADSRLNLVYGYSILFASIRDHSFVAFDPPPLHRVFKFVFFGASGPLTGTGETEAIFEWYLSMVQQSVPVSSSVVFKIEAFVTWFHIYRKRCIALYG